VAFLIALVIGMITIFMRIIVTLPFLALAKLLACIAWNLLKREVKAAILALHFLFLQAFILLAKFFL